MFDTPDFQAKDMAEYKARSEKAWDIKPLKDGERTMLVLPGFDFRDTEDARFGQHTATLLFAKRQGDYIVDVQFYTGWSVDDTVISFKGNKNISLMCLGLYTHTKLKNSPHIYYDTAAKNENCPFTGGKCYGELGSSLYGDVIKAKLVNFGSPGVWEEIDTELERLNGAAE